MAEAFAKAESLARCPVRGLVTCAGLSGRCPAVEYPVDSFRKILEINVVGSFLCARAAARIMRAQQNSGSVVMMASMSGTNVNRVSESTGPNLVGYVADGRRAWIRVRTTPRSRRSCSSLGIWLRNGGMMKDTRQSA